MIPLFRVRCNEREIFKQLKPVLRSGYIGEGEQVKRLEKALSEQLGGYTVLVNSGTSALHLAFHMSGVSGKEVITTPMTCLATNTPIVQNGGKIVWADVEPDSGNISLQSIKNHVTPKTKAVCVVHYGGSLCDPEIKALCDSKGLALIEDCAHLHSEGLGGLQCYSFQAIKFLTSGDGGALVTQDRRVYERAKLLRWYGIDREGGKDMRCMNPVYEVGYKFHMNDIAASVALANLKGLGQALKVSKRNAYYYNERFKGLASIQPAKVLVSSDYWLYVILCGNKKGLMEHLRQRGIATSLVHARNDTQPIFKKFSRKFEGLETFWDRQLCIPVGWWVTERDARYIADCVCEYDEICLS